MSARLLLLFALAMLPLGLPAASPAQQDYQEAIGKTPDPGRGERLFITCAGCHRQDGSGNRDGTVPKIAGQHLRVVVRQLSDYRNAIRWDPRRQHYAVKPVRPDGQAVAAGAAYVAGLERDPTAGVGPGDQVGRGRAVYAARCASCHGVQGGGDEAALVPRIGDQHFTHVLRMLRDGIEGTRPSFPADHLRLLEQLDPVELVALADAISRGPGATAR